MRPAIPHVRITAPAKAILRDWGMKVELKEHVPTIVWTGDSNGENWDWSVGTYVRSQVPGSMLITLDGIEFAIQESFRSKLEGKTLDYQNGFFFVR